MQLTELFASRTQNIDAKTFGAKEGLSEYQAQSLQWVCSPRLILSPGPSSAYNWLYQDELLEMVRTMVQQQEF